MQYGITRLVFSSDGFVGISHMEFKEAKLAKQNLTTALGIEEKFNIVLDNYAEYERELLNITVDYMLFSDHNWSSFANDRQTVTRRLSNLLSTCHLYMDQVSHSLSVIYGKRSTEREKFEQTKKEEYDSRLAYRVMSKLRNHIQHYSLPITNLEYFSAAQMDVPDSAVENIVTPYLNLEQLRENKKFPRYILAELEADGEKVDIKPLVREYIDSLRGIHELIRDLLAEDIANWDETILQIQQRYSEANGDKLIGLAVVEVEEDADDFSETVLIFDDPIKHRRWFEYKNRKLKDYTKHIVTSEVKRDSRSNPSGNVS